ncbi:hypothetical protein ElyMa_003153100 [Elysia marginata]|uniref:Uncharacterized protein n=1 Tax=Elysia marginata TaxID=1093978 RepID=A0AAV4IU63_9GAST|nr:hypothetical protein ElyMa_003153100 [Elysia marginata]
MSQRVTERITFGCDLIRLDNDHREFRQKKANHHIILKSDYTFFSRFSYRAPCTPEPEDTRVLPHANGSTNKDYRRIILHAVDTEVLVMAVSTVVYLEDTYIRVATSQTNLFIKRHDVHFPCIMP